MKITVIQKSREANAKTVDENATLQDLGVYKRISYVEKNGAVVILDITDHEISLKRQDSWLTQGLFRRNESTEMLVKNEHGTIVFDVSVDEMKIDNNVFYIRYHLDQEGQRVDTLEFECWWEPEV